MYKDMVALSMFRPSCSGSGLPAEGGTSDLVCLQHCEMSLENSERYWKMWPSSDYSIMSVHLLYNCASTLIHMLQHQHSHELLSRTCSLLLRHKDGIPFTLFLLQGLELIAECLEAKLPTSMMLSHLGLSLPADRLMDVPISFILPFHSETGACDPGSPKTGVELGELIAELGAQKLQS